MSEKAILAMLCLGGILTGCVSQGVPAFALGASEHQTLFSGNLNGAVSCYRIPAFVAAPDGTLVCAADERVDSCSDMDKNRDINIVLRTSRDAGNTWSPLFRAIDYPDGITASDPSLIADSVTGGLLLFYNYMDHNTAPGVYRLHVMKSGDAGQTWGAPKDITSQVIKPEWERDFHFVTSGNGTQTRAGKLLHTLVTRDGTYVLVSDDHGDNWSRRETLLSPGNESRIVELDDGAWMVNTRTSDDLDMRYTHLSKDQGKTWTTRPEPALVDPACNAGLIAAPSSGAGDQSSLLLFSNANAANARVNLTIRYSRDAGATWSEGRTVYPGQTAYSVLGILTDGDVGLVFEKDDYQEISFVRLKMEWITAE